MERTSYRLEDGERPSTAVITAIAEYEGSSPDEIRPQLYDAVDPDALDSLFQPRVDGTFRRGGSAVFTYRGYRITYESDGWIHVNDDQSTASGASEHTPADE
ncbi:HalOD1 output domain-containing protein [Haladaptatus caseinilyticus]|uniref:HalOD1 output domain-containing protein n=1 Tax=Haladaptatus caseinilyticus TaxID=2993314 RepID=UPI00224B22B6|nr:HalOD1 output domain-containing protein [Haladaptatus caseinilyticus]